MRKNNLKASRDNKQKKYDLHIHSYYSKCSRNSPSDILRCAKEANLDGIAITDHDSLQAYNILKEMNTDKDFEIIPGEEVRTQFGDVIGLYLRKEIKSRDFFEVIKEIKDQGGIVVIPHPFGHTAFTKFNYPLEKLKGKIDAIETFNSRNFFISNKRAVKAAAKFGFAQIGASDAHMTIDIGKGYTLFSKDLKTALKKKQTYVGGTNRHWMLSGARAILNKYLIFPIFGRRKEKYKN